MFDRIQDRSSQYPTFTFPLPREQGYEFILAQFAGKEVHFTPLINYQAYKENAPECLTLIYYDDLKSSKKIILMHGEFDKDSMSVEDAQFLANQIGIYYGTKDEKRLNLLETFHKCPENFDYKKLINEIENFDLTSFSKSI